MGGKIKEKAIIIFVISAAARLSLSLLYLNRFGWHTTPIIETYYYYGVANGTIRLSFWDLTNWILRLLGFFFKEDMLLYTVFCTGLLISSFTAVIFFLLARRILGDKGGFAAALIYAFTIQPLAMGVLLFTHDLIQMPVFMLFLYAGLRLKEEKKPIWAIALLILFFIGLKINTIIILALDIILLYYIYGLAYEYWKEKAPLAMSAFMVAVTMILVYMNIYGLTRHLAPTMLEIAARLSGYDPDSLLVVLGEGSFDLVPANFASLWSRYNLLWLFLPFGLYASFLKRNMFCLITFFIGLVITLIFERGTRVLDLGLAFMFANALLFWDKKWRTAYMFLFSLFFLILVGFALDNRLEERYLVMLLAPLFVSLPIGLLEKKDKWFFLPLLVFVSFNAIGFAVYGQNPSLSEKEYEAYKILAGSDAKGRILTSWTNGFAATAISRRDSFDNPAMVNNEYQIVLMMTDEKKAFARLANENVGFIVITDERFKTYENMIIADRFFLEYAENPSPEHMRRTLIFRMLYGKDLKYFEKIYEEKDGATGVRVLVYATKTKGVVQNDWHEI